MSSKLNVETFIAVLKRSGLLDPEVIQRSIADYHGAANRSEDCVALAERLIGLNLLTRWQVEKLLQGKHRGYFLGKYKLLSLLGKGGMSSVYLAEHLLMRRRCALKVLPAKRVDDSSYLERFHREAQAVAALDHPNIVRAYDVDHQNDGDRQIHFLVMEYVEGQCLQDMVGEHGLPSFLDAADCARQAAAGLQHAHEHHMIHRDVKPGNLLVDRNGVVKILDLGLAKFFHVDEGNDALTIRHDERVLGTADYLAPEQAIDSHRVDARADIYSLGCTLYFSVTGKPPFTEGTLAQRLLAHQIKTPPSVESLRGDAPPDLAAIIRRMMEKRPEDRYATASEAGEALYRWIGENADDTWRKAHTATWSASLTESWGSHKAIPVAQPVTTPSGTEPLDGKRSWGSIPVSSEKNPLKTTAHNVSGTQDTAINHLFSTLTQNKSEPAVANSKSSPTVKIPAAPTTDIAPGNRAPAKADSPVAPSTPAFPAFESSPKVNKPPLKKESGTIRALSPAKFNWQWVLQPKHRGVLIGASAFILLGLIYLVSELMRQSPSPGQSIAPATTPFPTEKREVTVGKDKAEFKSIRDALIAVRDRYHPSLGNKTPFVVRIQAGTYQEKIRIDGRISHWPDGVTIRGEGVVVLDAVSDEPVVRIGNVSQYTLENLQIQAKGPTAIELADDMHECRLQKLLVQGFTDCGIVCRGTQGLSFGSGQLGIVQTTFEPVSKKAVGIRLEEGSDNDVFHVVIRHCRFLEEMAAGVVIRGQAPIGIDVAESIFYRSSDGIRIDGQPAVKSLHVANNTFREVKTGIHFAQMPNDLSTDLVFRRNLFSKIERVEGAVDLGYDETRFRAMMASNPPGIENNWSDRPAATAPTSSEMVILFDGGGRRGETGFAFTSTDPQNAKFLAPSSTSPQREVAGAQPTDKSWVGATGP